jgi:hypothetical protein
MCITQTIVSKNIRIQQYDLIAKELELERNMNVNTMQLIMSGNAKENTVKCIHGSNRVALFIMSLSTAVVTGCLRICRLSMQ